MLIQANFIQILCFLRANNFHSSVTEPDTFMKQANGQGKKLDLEKFLGADAGINNSNCFHTGQDFRFGF